MKFLIRKLGASGDTCVTVSEQELSDHLSREFRNGFSAAIRTEEATRFVGDDLDRVLSEVMEAAVGKEEIELLLIPRVEGG